MKHFLLEEFKKHQEPSVEVIRFIEGLESSIASDLWQSAGGHWSSDSIEKIKNKAMKSFADQLTRTSDIQDAWINVVRDFHIAHWGEIPLLKKEKKPETKEQKIFWELFSYIWVLLQATLVTKTAIFYFGIKSAQDDDSSGRVYVVLAILFSFFSLGWFGYRRHKKKSMKE